MTLMYIDDFIKKAIFRAFLVALVIFLAIMLNSCSTVKVIEDTKMFSEQYLEVTPKQAERLQKRFKRYTEAIPTYNGKYLTLTKEHVELPKKHLKSSVLGRRYTKQLLNEQEINKNEQ